MLFISFVIIFPRKFFAYANVLDNVFKQSNFFLMPAEYIYFSNKNCRASSEKRTFQLKLSLLLIPATCKNWFTRGSLASLDHSTDWNFYSLQFLYKNFFVANISWTENYIHFVEVSSILSEVSFSWNFILIDTTRAKRITTSSTEAYFANVIGKNFITLNWVVTSRSSCYFKKCLC